MHIETLEVGQLGTNCYVVTGEDSRGCVIIDPGAESETILGYIGKNNLEPLAIFITHAHFDHVTALPEVQKRTGAPVYVHASELDGGNPRSGIKPGDLPDVRFYAEGDVIEFAGLRFTVMETPGHTSGSVTLMCGSALFTGDTLFLESCGRTDLGGDMDQMLASLRRLSAMGEFDVFPGHGEHTTLSWERRKNYYVRYANAQFPAQ